MKFLILALALAAGNFLYQLIFTGDYATAIERSYFQAVAVFAAWLIS